MQPVSPGFYTAALDTIRVPRARITVRWNDPSSIAAEFTVATNSDNHTTWKDHVADLMTVPSAKYCILDGSWQLEDDKVVAPGTVDESAMWQMGHYTAAVADADGDFTEGSYPTIDITWVEARKISALNVSGDSLLNQYPVIFSFVAYLSGTPVHTWNMVNNSSVSIEETFVAIDCDNVKLTIMSWSTPNTVAKILECYPLESTVFTGDDIVDMSVNEEIPSDGIGTSELNVTLQNINIQGVYHPFFPENTASPWAGYMLPRRKVTAEIGFAGVTGMAGDTGMEYGIGVNGVTGLCEYVNMGTFWTEEFKADEASPEVTIRCSDRMESLRSAKLTFPTEYYSNITLYAAINILLNHAKLNIPMPELQWTINASLLTYTIPGFWAGKTSYYDTLKDLLKICNGRAWFTRGDVLNVVGVQGADASDLSITDDYIISRKRPLTKVVNYCEVEPQNFITAEDITELVVTTVAMDALETKTVNIRRRPEVGGRIICL